MCSIVRENADIWMQPSNQRRPIDPPAIDRLAAIAVPTVVIVGGEDLVDTHNVGDLLADRIPSAELARVSGAGHFVNLAAAPEFNCVLLDYLERTPGKEDNRSTDCPRAHTGKGRNGRCLDASSNLVTFVCWVQWIRASKVQTGGGPRETDTDAT